MRNHQKTIERRAARWVVKLSLTSFPLDNRLQRRLQAWIARSEQHRIALSLALNTWRQLKQLPPLSSHQICAPEIRQIRRSGRWGWPSYLRLAAAFGLLLLLGSMLPTPLAASSVFYATGIGQHRTIALEDGTVVELNTATRVWVRSGGRSRQIQLMEGDALFSVATDSSRPFQVFAPFAIAAADDALMAVSRSGATTTIVMVKGSGSVTSPCSASTGDVGRIPMDFRTGQALTVWSGTGPCLAERSLTDSDVERVLSWRQGELWFDDEPADAVADTFNHYNAVKVSIDDPGLATRRISGHFNAYDPASFVLALEKAAPDAMVLWSITDTGLVTIRVTKTTSRVTDPENTAAPR